MSIGNVVTLSWYDGDDETASPSRPLSTMDTKRSTDPKLYPGKSWINPDWAAVLQSRKQKFNERKSDKLSISGGVERVSSTAPPPSSSQSPRKLKSFTFPVIPENIDLRYSWDTQDQSFLNAKRTVSRPGNSNPIELSFSSFFPDADNLWPDTEWLSVPHGELLPPYMCVQLLRGLCNSAARVKNARPLLVSVAGLEPLSFSATITSFDIQLRPGPSGDIYFDIGFREIGTKNNIIGLIDGDGKASRRGKQQPKKTKVMARKNESLTDIVKRGYGWVSPDWVKQVLDKNPNLPRDPTKFVTEGTVVKL